jgi:DNA-binding Lrp family transcriptional regulator
MMASVANHSWTDADSRKLFTLVRDGGLSQGEIAEKLGRSQATISRKLREFGITTNSGALVDLLEDKFFNGRRSSIEQLQLTNEQRRAKLAEKLLAVAETEVQRLELLTGGHYTDLVKGEGGAETLRDLVVIPSRSLQAHANGIDKLVTAVSKLDAMNKDYGSADIDKYMNYMLGPDSMAVEEIVIEDAPEPIEGIEGDSAPGSDEGIHEQS